MGNRTAKTIAELEDMILETTSSQFDFKTSKEMKKKIERRDEINKMNINRGGETQVVLPDLMAQMVTSPARYKIVDEIFSSNNGKTPEIAKIVSHLLKIFPTSKGSELFAYHLGDRIVKGRDFVDFDFLTKGITEFETKEEVEDAYKKAKHIQNIRYDAAHICWWDSKLVDLIIRSKGKTIDDIFELSKNTAYEFRSEIASTLVDKNYSSEQISEVIDVCSALDKRKADEYSTLFDKYKGLIGKAIEHGKLERLNDVIPLIEEIGREIRKKPNFMWDHPDQEIFARLIQSYIDQDDKTYDSLKIATKKLAESGPSDKRVHSIASLMDGSGAWAVFGNNQERKFNKENADKAVKIIDRMHELSKQGITEQFYHAWQLEGDQKNEFMDISQRALLPEVVSAYQYINKHSPNNELAYNALSNALLHKDEEVIIAYANTIKKFIKTQAPKQMFKAMEYPHRRTEKDLNIWLDALNGPSFTLLMKTYSGNSYGTIITAVADALYTNPSMAADASNLMLEKEKKIKSLPGEDRVKLREYLFPEIKDRPGNKHITQDVRNSLNPNEPIKYSQFESAVETFLWDSEIKKIKTQRK